MSRMHAATKPQVLGLLLVLAGAAIRLRGNADVGMVIVAGLFTVITAPVLRTRATRPAQRHSSARVSLGSMMSSMSNASALRNGERTLLRRSVMAREFVSTR